MGFGMSALGTITTPSEFRNVCVPWSEPSSCILSPAAASSHKAVKDQGGPRGANSLSCLHMTCKAINLYNLCEVIRRQTLLFDFITTVQIY